MSGRLSSEAEADLDDIWSYIATESGSYRADGKNVLVLRVIQGSRQISALLGD